MTAPFRPEPLPRRDVDWGVLVPRVGCAQAALARYDEALKGLANLDIILSPLTAREAVLSSRIEGTQASLEDVLEYEADPQPGENPRYRDILEVINYRRALETAVEELRTRPLSLNLLRRAHFVLLDGVRGHDKARGEFRRSQVYTASAGMPIGRATYVPPAAPDIQPLLDNLETYLHAAERDSIVQAAWIHAQLELIHPFVDGNGRVGRMLVPLFLYAAGTLSAPRFYISAYLEAHRDTYYARLKLLSAAGDWQRWTEFFLDGVAAQAEADVARVRAILALYERTKAVLAEQARSVFAIRTLDVLFETPIFATPHFIERSGAPRTSAGRILAALVESKTLVVLREGQRRRPTVYVFPELLGIVRSDEGVPAVPSPVEPTLMTVDGA